MPMEGDDGSRIHKFLTDLEDESESVQWHVWYHDVLGLLS